MDGLDREINEIHKESYNFPEKSMNALRSANAFDGLDRKIDECLKESDFFWEAFLNALRNSKLFGSLYRETTESLKGFDIFKRTRSICYRIQMCSMV